MIVIGFVFLAAAVAAASVLIAQNNDATLNVKGLGYTWNVHAYWLLVAGLVIAAAAVIGLSLMRRGTTRYVRLRREHRGLVRDHERLVATSHADAGDSRPADERQPVPSPTGYRQSPTGYQADAATDTATDGGGSSGRFSRMMHPRRGSHSQPVQR
jgi:hypothetical protein